MRPKLTLAFVAAAALLTAMPAAAQITVGPTSCTAGAFNTIECSYDFSVSGDPGSTTVEITGTWFYTYQCVHEKNGKANKKYEYLIGYLSQTTSSSGTSGTATVNPPSTPIPTDLCADNKGPYTVTSPLSGLAPFSWRVELITENLGSALVEGTL